MLVGGAPPWSPAVPLVGLAPGSSIFSPNQGSLLPGNGSGKDKLVLKSMGKSWWLWKSLHQIHALRNFGEKTPMPIFEKIKRTIEET